MLEIALRKGWTRVDFGDVVKLSGERSSNPHEDGFERFVGLEHIDPGDLKLRRWGDIADGTTFTTVFRRGQVLFGKRRAYQRKVAVADFDGVCSGDIYVLEPKNARLLPEVLSFICQTDGFFEHAVGTSAGSLSPRTNWHSLSSYVFALAPLEEQRRFVSLLMSIDTARGQFTGLVARLESLLDALFESSVALDRRSRTGRIDEFCEFVTDGDHNPPPRVQKGIPHLVVANLRDGSIDDTECSYISESDFDRVSRRYTPRAGDVLLSCVGSIGATALVPEGLVFSADRSLAIYRPKKSALLPEFALRLLRSRRSQDYFRSAATGTAQLHLYLNELRRQVVKIPSIEVQTESVRRVGEVEDLLRSCFRRASELASLRDSVLVQLVRAP